MTAPRLRIQLGVPHDGPTKFWWQPSPAAQTIFDVLEELAVHLGLAADSAARLVATMGGFVVLPGSRTDLLRDGDLLVISKGPGRKRSAPEAAAVGQAEQQAKRLKGPATTRLAAPAALPGPAGGTANRQDADSSSSGESSSEEDGSSSSSSSSEEDDSSSSRKEGGSSEDTEAGSGSTEEASTSSEEGESSGSRGQGAGGEDAGHLVTPAAPAPAPAKKPSRSARRKAAKRRLRRMGVLPPKAAKQAGPGAAAAGQAGPAGEPRRKPGNGLPQQAAAPQRHEVVRLEDPARQQACAGAPEVIVPSNWQQHWADAEGQQPQRKRGQRGTERQAPKQAEQAAQAICPPTQEPFPESAFEQLASLAGLPSVGAVLAYRLLEVGPELRPGVSEVRCGRVSAVDAATQQVTLAPHPDPSTHPLAYQRSLRAAQRQAQAAAAGGTASEDEDEEELGSLYDEDGTLTVQLSAFVELRLLEHAPSVDAGGPAQQAEHALAVAAAPANGSSTQPVVAAAQQPEDLGPSSYSQLGPPKPAAVRGHVIAPEGGWASLYQQLQQRRSQLAAQQAGDRKSVV